MENHNRKTLTLTVGALLMALSFVIPLTLGGTVSLVLGPFTATPASHVPTLLAVLFGPFVAGAVGLGSAIGFFLKMGQVVGMRAAMHIPVGILGALLLQRKVSFPLVLGLIAPIHAFLEALIVLAFGFTLQKAGFVVGLGTLVHHTFDSLVAVVLWGVLLKSRQLTHVVPSGASNRGLRR